jgi:NTP pyrophosphatase (non-canonical NTP hydrolase)
MKTEDYEKFTDTTDRSNTKLWYYALGIVGESGEVADNIKKLYRDKAYQDDYMQEADRTALIRELGDNLWYIVRIARQKLGITLGDVMAENVRKLEGRMARGTLNGNGDHR